jgi:nucleotide-binding universal stress UspA family protein
MPRNLLIPSAPAGRGTRSSPRAIRFEWILAAGADFDADLIVMTTEGHNSLFDLLRGSTTERVVRGARCPLLAIPA